MDSRKIYRPWGLSVLLLSSLKIPVFYWSIHSVKKISDSVRVFKHVTPTKVRNISKRVEIKFGSLTFEYERGKCQELTMKYYQVAIVFCGKKNVMA